jgi:hypothetical protein
MPRRDAVTRHCVAHRDGNADTAWESICDSQIEARAAAAFPAHNVIAASLLARFQVIVYVFRGETADEASVLHAKGET